MGFIPKITSPKYTSVLWVWKLNMPTVELLHGVAGTLSLHIVGST